MVNHQYSGHIHGILVDYNPPTNVWAYQCLLITNPPTLGYITPLNRPFIDGCSIINQPFWELPFIASPISIHMYVYIYIYISYLVIDSGRLKCGSQVTQEFDFAPESVQKDGTDTMITSWLFMSIPAVYALSTPWFPISSILTTGCVLQYVSISLKIWFQGHWKASRGRSALATTARHQAIPAVVE